MQTRDQHYSTIVYECVQKIKNTEYYKLYGSLSHKLPILIHTAGLAQALAFVHTRIDKEISKQFLDDLARTVDQGDGERLLKNVREAKLGKYMLLTQQVLAALLWYKRFAQSILDVETDDNSGGNQQ